MFSLEDSLPDHITLSDTGHFVSKNIGLIFSISVSIGKGNIAVLDR